MSATVCGLTQQRRPTSPLLHASQQRSPSGQTCRPGEQPSRTSPSSISTARRLSALVLGGSPRKDSQVAKNNGAGAPPKGVRSQCGAVAGGRRHCLHLVTELTISRCISLSLVALNRRQRIAVAKAALKRAKRLNPSRTLRNSEPVERSTNDRDGRLSAPITRSD